MKSKPQQNLFTSEGMAAQLYDEETITGFHREAACLASQVYLAVFILLLLSTRSLPPSIQIIPSPTQRWTETLLWEKTSPTTEASQWLLPPTHNGAKTMWTTGSYLLQISSSQPLLSGCQPSHMTTCSCFSSATHCPGVLATLKSILGARLAPYDSHF